MSRKLLLVSIVVVLLVVLAAVSVLGERSAMATRSRDYILHFDLPPSGAAAALPRIRGPLDASRPLVVIDAGHGGHDPGAHNGMTSEKDLALALAKALEAKLLAGGGIRVAMTRSDDRYLLLDERSGYARRLNADLFISIHADSAQNAAASGATVYFLSARGSSEAAQRLADSENRADTVNGIPLGHAGTAVSAILVDLAQRRTHHQSQEFAGLVLREGHDHMAFREWALQSAAFVVLKSPDVPSVLFEAGYISNPPDAARLASAAGRQAFAETSDRAIRVFFARQAVPADLATP